VHAGALQPLVDDTVVAIPRAAHMVHDDSRDLLYVSLVGGPQEPAGVLAVDSDTGAIVRREAMAELPDELAISDDGQFLYVGLDAVDEIRQIRLADWSVVREITLQQPSIRPAHALDIEVMPGVPETIAVVRGIEHTGRDGVAIYDSGVQRPVTVQPVGSSGATDVAFGAGPARLYGSFTGPQAVGVWRMDVAGSGLTLLDNVSPVSETSATDMVFDEGDLFFGSGRVLVAETGQLLRNLQLGSSGTVAVDPMAAELLTVGGPAGTEVAVRDSVTLELVKSLSSNPVGRIAGLLSLGAGRYAMLADPAIVGARTTQVHLLDTWTNSARGEYHALAPQRILDTRSGLGRGGHIGKVGAGETIVITVIGVGGVPLTGVDSVVMNVTATNPTAAGFLTLWPTGGVQDDVSTLNFVAGQTVANLVTMSTNALGQVSLFNEQGQTDVIFDIGGYYASAGGARGDRFTALAPARVLDTRVGVGRPAGRIATAPFDVAVLPALPVGAAPTAVALNVTVVGPSTWSYLTVFPSGQPQPDVSDLNYVAGQTAANQVIVPVSPTGTISVANEFGTIDVIVDVVGFYHSSRVGEIGRFIHFEPYRWFDSRVDTEVFGGKLHNGEGLVIGPDLTWVSAYVMNVTVTGAEAPGYVTAFPSTNDAPLASALNFATGQTVANHVIVGATPTSTFDVTGGPTHLIIDVFGAFT
jgi:hypothetical protein